MDLLLEITSSDCNKQLPVDPFNLNSSIDPVPTIDPSVQNPGAYSFAFSDGVGNSVGAVPEPAIWAMMLMGVGIIGAALRYRRRPTAAAYA